MTMNTDGSYQFYEWRIRPDQVAHLEAYIQTGRDVGDFLTGIITNNLMKACSHADQDNKRNIPAFAGYLFNVAPAACHGSVEAMKRWQEHNGLEGLQARIEGHGTG